MSPEQDPDAHPATVADRPYLTGLSSLAARSFSSNREATDAVLRLVSAQLGVRSSFLTRISRDDGRQQIIASYNQPGGSAIPAEAECSLPDNFCSLIAAAPVPAPLVIDNTRTDPRVAGTRIALANPNIGSYLGVPISQSDGQLFGTLCAVDPDPQHFTPAHTDTLVILARLLATQIERDREVFERRRAVTGRLEAERRFKTVFDQAPVGIALLDLRGRFVETNPALHTISGYSRQDFARMSLQNLLTPEPHSMASPVFLELQSGKRESFCRTQQYFRHDGGLIWVNLTVSMIRDEQGAPEYIIALVEDVTERKQAEIRTAQALATQRAAIEELRRINKAKGDFVSIVSHEFRTPLTVIQGYSEIMRDDEFSPEEVQDYASEINSQAIRLNSLLTEMLDLDRLESGRVQLQRSPLNLNDVIGEAARQAQAAEPGRQLSLDLAPDLPAISGDHARLAELFTNLINHALHHSTTGTSLGVLSRNESSGVHAAVAYRGPGVPPEELERIFERYMKIETPGAAHVQDNGLALPKVRQIARLHGGNAWAESTLGQGVVVHVTLPLAAEGAK